MRYPGAVAPTCRTLLVLLAATVATAATAAAAQEKRATVSRSFAQLGTDLRPGDDVRVTTATGVQAAGKVGGIDVEDGTLTLVVDEQAIVFMDRNVVAVTRREADSLANGALIGLAAGVAPVALFALTCDHGCGGLVDAAFVYGGIGAGIGVLVDVAVKTDRLVYVRGNGGALKLRLAPLLARDAKGALLTLRF